MTEKRFTISEVDFTILDYGERLSLDEIADLLNDQDATIQDLTEELGKMEKEIKQS